MAHSINRRTFAATGLAAAGLSACAAPDPLGEDLPPMGDFELAFTVVVSENAKKIPPSRTATPEQLKSVMTAEVERRFGAYSGGTGYVIALNIDGYSLAPPGIPIVLTPKSILVVSANLWRADPQEKLAGAEQISTFEGAETLLLGSGLVKDADQQLETLCRNMARKVQAWLLRNPTLIGLPAGAGRPPRIDDTDN
ncbi:hypothetical protein [Jannaschia donghaensis]|uniref:Lipoprotein n=1 Tax=Jannaschia donghaensis TaxID=420998 RepID=A0A0M6YJI9_9RHOB|nr:hypothetical protein [Jannaschia donghaensis]CTQ50084.1 hypothetical protein JDO7802_02102 [Jannaschia donghaensis]